MSSRCPRSCKPDGQVSSAAHNVKTPKQSHRKFKGAPDPPYRAHGVAAGGAACTVKYDALTRQRWLPSRQFGKPVYLHGAGVMAQRLSRRVSGFNSPYAGPAWVESECDAGGFRSTISVAAPFVWRCLTRSTVAPVSTPLSSNR